MEPVSFVSLALSVLTVAVVAYGVRKTAAQSRAAKAHYRAALYAAETAKDELEVAANLTAAARADLEAAHLRAAEFRAELGYASGVLRDTTSGVNDLADAVEKQNDILESAPGVPPDTNPEGSDSLTPVSHVRWTEDGDDHYNQVTLWPTGGGIDINTAINCAAQSVSLSWKEFDLIAAMADRLRRHDDEAPEPVELVNVEDLPYGDELTAEEAAARAVWAEVADDAALFDAFNAATAAAEAAHDSPRPHDGWRDPELEIE